MAGRVLKLITKETTIKFGRMMSKYHILVGVLLGGWIATVAQASSLNETMNGLIATHPHVAFGVEVIRADNGQCLYQYRAHHPLMPASNMKIVTTAAALETLGRDYTFKTEVGLDGDRLVFVGSGDPLLGDEQEQDPNQAGILNDVTRMLQQRGVQDLTDIIVDSTCFDDQRVHPHWPVKDLNKDYSSEICGLNYHDNCIDVTVRNQGGRAVVQLDPQTAYVEIQNQVKVVSHGLTGVGAYRVSGQPNVWQIKGRVRREQGPFAAPVEKPAAFFGFLCAETLARHGIRVTGQLREQAFVPGPGYKELTTYHHSLEEVMTRCNRDSFNLAAESLIKTMARHSLHNNQGGSWDVGRMVVSQYLQSLGLSADEFHIDDGSGLSHENRLSAHVLVSVLLDMHAKDTWSLFERSLAVGGVNGTLDSRFLDERYRGKVRAKSGFIGDAGVRTLSGLCDTDSGLVFFSILTNGGHYMVRQTITKMAQAIIDCL